jgi:hypothetical protein
MTTREECPVVESKSRGSLEDLWADYLALAEVVHGIHGRVGMLEARLDAIEKRQDQAKATDEANRKLVEAAVEQRKRESNEPRKDGHVPVECHCGKMGCMFCDGGLFACKVCGALEGATASECPGRRMSDEEKAAVYNGTLDYRGGEWVKECSPHSPFYYRVQQRQKEGR